MKERRLLVLIAVGIIAIAGAFLYTRSQNSEEPLPPPPPQATSTAPSGTETQTPAKTQPTQTATTPTQTSATATTTTTQTQATNETSSTTLSEDQDLPPAATKALNSGKIVLIEVSSKDAPEDRELTKVVRRFSKSSASDSVAIIYLTPGQVARYKGLAETITRTPAIVVLDSPTSASVNEGFIEYDALVALVARKKN